MTDETRVADIETRLAYQEAAIEGLTKASLEQQRVIDELQSQLTQVMKMLKEAAPGIGGLASDEPPPPHY
jgi:SlyX protein